MAGFDLIKINVISELRRRDREPATWWCSALKGGRPGTSLLRVLTLGQTRSGVKRLAAACRQQAFRNCLEQELPTLLFWSGADGGRSHSPRGHTVVCDPYPHGYGRSLIEIADCSRFEGAD
jgi:hypothetical protein